MQSALPTYSYKLVMLGDMAVGKSSMIFRFVRNRFQEQMEPTIGAAFITQSVELNNCVVKYEIWDTAGQERYATLAPMYYRAAPCAVVVFDITNAASFKRAKDWVEELKSNGSPGCVIAIAGNKSDMSEMRQVSQDEAKEFATQKNLIFVETSAKSGDGIQDLFVKIANQLPRNVRETGPNLNVFEEDKKDKSGCC
ncbi:Rab2a [Hexamita inflata]|uniref:Rab2a n=1 Tax=Hexamita inflata TaxID=28002 RepID=A0AA86P4R9_9EUKA|nr:Rab2a [Hexamita inflata]CAI9966264.1 Rab2a [Hexamita inflata]CAI9976943.1 Rab2a [Hexamita inflata]